MSERERNNQDEPRKQKETRKQKENGTKVWPWIIVGTGIFILGFVMGHLFWGIYWAGDDYKVFRDLLAFVLSFLGVGAAVLGFVVYRLILQGLDRTVEEKIREVDARCKDIIEEETNRVIARFYTNLNVLYWKHYEPEDYEIDDKIKQADKPYLDMAIEQSNYALRLVESLKGSKRLDARTVDGRICLAKNNLAYHLAMRGSPDKDDIEKAIPLATYAYEKVGDYDYGETCRWEETYAFVLVMSGDPQKRKQGIDVIKEMLKRKDLTVEREQYIRKRYRKVLG